MKELLEKYKKDPKSLSKEEIKKIQSHLNEKGYDISFVGGDGKKIEGASAIDGALGESTIRAIDEYSTTTEETPTETPAVATEESGFDKAFADTQQGKVAEQEENTKISEAETQAKRDSANAYNISDTAVSLAKLGRSAQQIRQGDRLLKDLQGQRPTLGTYGSDPALDKALQDAQVRAGKGLSDRTLGAMAGQNLAAYQGGLRAAQEASGGQAGVYGSQAQNLYSNALANARQIGMMDDEALTNAQSNLRGMVMLNQADRQFDQGRQDTWKAGQLQDWRDANINAQALRNVGEQNLWDNLGTIPYKTANRVGDYSTGGYGQEKKGLDNLIAKQRNRKLLKANTNNNQVNLYKGAPAGYNGGVFDTDRQGIYK